jgi:hypothetical protein
VATKNRMSLLEQLSKYVVEKDKDFLKEALTLLINAIITAKRKLIRLFFLFISSTPSQSLFPVKDKRYIKKLYITGPVS